jgi:hypothetical protein
LNHRLRVDRLDCTWIGQPEINIKDRNPQAEDSKPTQDRLNMPGITLLEPNRKE